MVHQKKQRLMVGVQQRQQQMVGAYGRPHVPARHVWAPRAEMAASVLGGGHSHPHEPHPPQLPLTEDFYSGAEAQDDVQFVLQP
mmetsp:Transcript_72764/g.106687  ORF Transcript_72764/g.106687 Transcript_72764/m.106687 type:complete len:84 (-) Transcript_72764:629-880(-)